MRLTRSQSSEDKDQKVQNELDMIRKQREIRKSQTKLESFKLKRQLSMKDKEKERESDMEKIRKQRESRRSKTMTEV